jgi:hypothetical protein
MDFTDILERHGCSHVLIHDLLALLKENGHPELPLTATTLYKVDGDEQPNDLVTKPIGDGQFWHRENAFKDWDADLFQKSVQIDVFTDGFPLVKNSRLVGWHILGGVVNKPNWPVLLFSFYAGYGSPSTSDELLSDFAEEAEILLKNGILVGAKKVKIPFEIRNFLADALARAYFLSIRQATTDVINALKLGIEMEM